MYLVCLCKLAFHLYSNYTLALKPQSSNHSTRISSTTPKHPKPQTPKPLNPQTPKPETPKPLNP